MDFTDADNFVPIEEFGIQDTVQSCDNFQKFMYELFDKNGIINDLRAYLRGHIVNILKSAETGDLPACQKHFTQRLELPFQAFNVLIVEYLLTMEFNYTLSVFISEIPLANMVFEFTKALMNSDSEAKMSSLQFEDGDVWSVLNYIGLKCSSEHALKIVEMYKSEKQPLLICILKCVSMYQKDEGHISDQSSITQSSDTLGEKTQGSHGHISKCKHFMYCKACQYRMARLKEKYKRKKAKVEKKKRSSIKKVNVDTFMNKMSVLEQTLIDEMFQKLKTVYEAEVEMVKEEQHKKIQQSIASHALQLQKHREEMEQSFKDREEELSQAIQQKKRFLWGLARSLRDQHAHLTRAMTDVRRQTERLTHKESTLKTQLDEAEKTLKKRGEDMRNQISDELVILERHLNCMKKERDSINQERREIENIKNVDKISVDNDFKPQYDFLKTELCILRKYIEATKLEPKCVIEKGTITDFGVKCFMNNENIGYKMEKFETNRVINDLKKQNNNNFNQSNLEDINDINSERPSSGDTGAMRDDTGDIQNGDNLEVAIQDVDKGDIRDRHLRVDVVQDRAILDVDKGNIRDRHLRVGDIQDGVKLDVAKGNIQDRHLRVEDIQDGAILDRNEGNIPDRHLRVGDIEDGAAEDRHCDVDILRQENIRLKSFASKQREYIEVLVNEKDRLQRALTDQTRPRTAPVGSHYSKGQRVTPEVRGTCPRGSVSGQWRVSTPWGAARGLDTRGWWTRRASGTTLHAADDIICPVEDTNETQQQNTSNRESHPEADKVEERCTKSFLKESKKIRNNTVKHSSPKSTDKSSEEIVREAKRRLRKLEIEAEAVEKSYQDFRRRQREMREKRENLGHARDNLIGKVENFDIKHKTLENDKKITTVERNLSLPLKESMRGNLDKYMKEFTSKMLFRETRFGNNNSVIGSVKPIPKGFGTDNNNYLETPILEFRKLYHRQETVRNNDQTVKSVNVNEKTYSENKIKGQSSNKIDNKTVTNNVKTPKDVNEEKYTESKLKSVQSSNVINNKNEVDLQDISKTAPKQELAQTSNKARDIVINNQITHKQDDKSNLQMVAVDDGGEGVCDGSKDNKSNLLMVAVEDGGDSVCDESNNLLIVVESSVDGLVSDDGEQMTHVTVTVTPKDRGPKEFGSPVDVGSRSPECSKLDAAKAISGDEESEVEKERDEYLDDFSADVDNYNSPSECGNNSPISLPKTPEDYKLW